MEQKIKISMSKNELEGMVRELARQSVEKVLREQEKRLSYEISNEIFDRVHHLLEAQIRDLIRHKFEEIMPKLIDSFADSTTNDLINRDSSMLRACAQMALPDQEGLTAKRSIERRLKGAKSLLITDPYFFTTAKGLTDEEYVEELLGVLPCGTLGKLIIIYQEQKKSSAINCFKNTLPKSIDLVLITDDSIHDRVWMVDWKKAYSVGTSFNGIGKKLTFISRLSKQDLIDFMAYLKDLSEKRETNQLSTFL
jgi:hypothetical protein